jgi:mono/diheme cytochrome c family protein
MNSLKIKFAIVLLVVGLLSACGSQPTQAPASQPTEPAVSGTEAPVAADTSVPAAESSPTAETAPAGASVSFATDILPMLESRCASCHGGNRTEEGLSLKSYADVMAGSEGGAVVIAGDSGDSLLADMVTSQKMPKRGPKLTPPQIQLIVDWINQGALDN